MKSPRHMVRFIKPVAGSPLLLLALTFAFGAGGCVADPSTPGSRQASGPSQDDAAFAAGDHRPATAGTLFSMARILEAQGKDSEAEFVLRTIVRDHPAFMPAYCELAETLLRQRRIDEAVRTLDTGLTRSRTPDAILLNDLGMCQLLRDDPSGALKYFTRAAAIAPDDARYRSNMAVSLGMTGRYAESFALYREVLPDADAHYNLGVLCQERHDQARADQEFQLAQPSATRPSTAPISLPSERAQAAEQPDRSDPEPRVHEAARVGQQPTGVVSAMIRERLLPRTRSTARWVLDQEAGGATYALSCMQISGGEGAMLQSLSELLRNAFATTVRTPIDATVLSASSSSDQSKQAQGE